ncbi:hypothetical protein [Pseudoalteromonas distincta]|uniref:hypothetical protein n=1 Tax=Pseudoalteromonas distincta TaxID=77608 RepID=UPI0032E11ED5
MTKNRELTSRLEAYLDEHRYYFKGAIPNRIRIWVSPFSDAEITLPEPALVDHPQSNELIKDAITDLAKDRGVSFSDFLNSLENTECDTLEIRASGEQIAHGRIQFKEALEAMDGLYSLLKLSASNNLQVKGKNSLVNEYLDGVNMLVPKPGSFIYRTEIKLLKQKLDDENSDKLIETQSLGRFLNERLAIQLQSIVAQLQSSPKSQSELYRIGLSHKLCNYLLKLFSQSCDLVEFKFNWSTCEPINIQAPQKITFSKKQKSNLELARNLLKQSSTKVYKDLPAFIEKYIWPKDAEIGKVCLKLQFDKEELVCTLETNEELYGELKKLKVKGEVAITAQILLIEGVKRRAEILELYQINTGKSQFIDF